MADKTYKTRGIVLRKTKLGEKDLIVTLLDESGSIVRAVAKGARKPGGSYAAKLELFSTVDLMLARGRSLDVITSAAFSATSDFSSFDIEQTSCASVLAELLATLAQEDLPNERLFAMAEAAFAVIACSGPLQALAITCSALLKAFAYTGFRPSFNHCVSCGNGIEASDSAAFSLFSIADGGVVCSACPQPSDALRVDTHTIQWCDALMRSRFEDVLSFDPSTETLFDILHLLRQWTRVHVGKSLKSFGLFLSSGLF